MKRTIVYVGGFNLYYGCLKGTSYRWLNLVMLSELALSSQNRIVAVKYYTARVDARPGNEDQPVRQDAYFVRFGPRLRCPFILATTCPIRSRFRSRGRH